MGNPKEPFDENSGNSESYLRKGFNFTKGIFSTSKYENANKQPDLPVENSTLTSIWNSSSSAVKSSYNWMSGTKSEKDTNNNNTKLSDDSKSYLKRAANYSAETSVGIYDWAFGSRKNKDDENHESRAKSLANSTLSGLNSSLGFSKSVVTGTYGYFFPNKNENTENSETNYESSTTAYVKDLATYGLSSSWGFMKSVARGGYGLISSPSDGNPAITDKDDSEKQESRPIEQCVVSPANKIDSEKSESPNGAINFVKDLGTSGLSASWGIVKWVAKGGYGLISSSSDGNPVITDQNGSEEAESKTIEPTIVDSSSSNGAINFVKDLGTSGLSASWGIVKWVAKGGYGLISSSSDGNPAITDINDSLKPETKTIKLDVIEQAITYKNVSEKPEREPIEQAIKYKNNSEKPETEPIEPPNRLIISTNDKKLEQSNLDENKNVVEKNVIKEIFEDLPSIDTNALASDSLKPETKTIKPAVIEQAITYKNVSEKPEKEPIEQAITYKNVSEKPETEPIEPPNLDENKNVVEKNGIKEIFEDLPSIDTNAVASAIKKATYWSASSTWSLMKNVGKGTYGLMFSSEDPKKEFSFDRIETNPKFANFDIKKLPAGQIKPLNSKNLWTKLSQDQFSNYLKLDGIVILNKISKKFELKNFETIKEYGEWWNNLGGKRSHHNFTFMNIETDSIVKKYFHRTSTHQYKFKFDFENGIPPPRQYPSRYLINKKFPSIVYSIKKNIVSSPNLHRIENEVKKHLKVCNCPILKFNDSNLDVALRIEDIEIYDVNKTEYRRSAADQEEELKTTIFRLKVLLGFAVFYMIVKN